MLQFQICVRLFVVCGVFTDTQHVKKSCDNFSFIQLILNLIPVLRWLPKYSLKNDLPGDISAGFTVAVMHIPQGMPNDTFTKFKFQT